MLLVGCKNSYSNSSPKYMFGRLVLTWLNDLMPWRHWRMSALWQLHIRDCRSRFSNGLCHGRDCQHQEEADVMLHNFLLHCPITSFLAFRSDGCHVCAREVTCVDIWLSIRTTWPKYDRRHALTTSTMSLSIARSFIMSVLRLWSLLEHHRIFLTIAISKTLSECLFCSFKVQVSALCSSMDWTELRYTRTFVSLLISLAFQILSRFRATPAAIPILRAMSLSQAASLQTVPPRYTNLSTWFQGSSGSSRI